MVADLRCGGAVLRLCGQDVTQSFADAKRERELTEFEASQHWNAYTKEQFQKLQAMEEEFEQTRTGFEVDLSGTARSMFALQEQGACATSS